MAFHEEEELEAKWREPGPAGTCQASLNLLVISLNHDGIQLWCLQIPFLANSNLEPHREEDSVKQFPA